MQLGFLRGGGKFHVRGEQRELRAAPLGAHAGTDTGANAAPDATANTAPHAETYAYADAVAVAAPDVGADALA